MAISLVSTTLHAQAPTNNTVGNATEITTFPLNDNNVRIDLSNLSTGGASGCNAANFKTVYYKFTATQNAQIDITLTDPNGTALGNNFLLFYTASSLNVTNENELTSYSPCVYSNGTNSVYVTQGTHYYIMVHRVGVNLNSNIAITKTDDVPQAERNALIDLYNSTAGANWNRKTNWNTNSLVSSWEGVTTQNVGSTTRVTALDLQNNNLTGTLPTSIGNLTALTNLNLSRNYNLEGTLPSQIGNLTALTNLKSDYCRLTGTLPTSIGNLTALTLLNLRGNSLEGALPNQIGNLTELTKLYLDNNKFTSLPTTIVSLTKLVTLNVYGNNISGAFPDITAITTLNILNIGYNLFEFADFENEFTTYKNNITNFYYSPQKTKPEITLDGSANVTVGENRTLTISVSGANNVYKWYKDEVLISQANTETLTLNNIQTTDFGNYTCKISNTVVTDLEIVSEKIFVGNILPPNQMPDYNTLVDLYNSLNGSQWTDKTNWLSNEPLHTWKGITINGNNRVVKLELFNNNLTGSIPNYIENLSELTTLNLSNNSLQNAIPTTIGNLTKLKTLGLSGNQLSGEIPTTIGNLTNLEIIGLGRNKLTGSIPTTIGNLINLKALRLGFGNELSGNIPAELGNLTNLTFLDLYQAGNLTGTIPKELGNLVNLERLYIGFSQISGTIPPELGNLTNCKQFVLWYNQLYGSIPKELGNLTNVSQIWLSNNQLLGSIPNELTNLTKLTQLYLNNNQLDGTVPNFSTNTVKRLRLENNYFTFANLETNFTANNTLESFTYAPQNFNTTDTGVLVAVGNNTTLDATQSGANNQYQWYFNNNAISGETSATLTLNNIQHHNMGNYHCVITNSVVTDLSFTTGKFIVGLNPTTHPDYDALVAFFNSTGGNNWTNKTNWLDTTKPISSWHGIHEQNGRVYLIDLVNNNLSGRLPAEIGNLSELLFLQLPKNPNLWGRIPESIGNLTKLESIGLYECRLYGEVPVSIQNLTNLRFISLFNNQLSGNFPNLSNLTNLTHLTIGQNYFTGAIPVSPSANSSLEGISIWRNNFEGAIPDFTSLSNLQVLWIHENKFQFGDFENQHATYTNTANLNYAFAPQKLIDEPKGYGLTIGSTQTLTGNASGTQNSYQWYKNGTAISGATQATYQLTINSTADYGTYHYTVTSSLVNGLTLRSHPITIGEPASNHPDYPALVALYNSTNGDNWKYSWDLNAPISTWSRLTFDANNRVSKVELQSNNLTGTLPTEIGDLTTLTVLNLNFNNITGSIPSQVGNLTNLTELRFFRNDLSGVVPNEVFNLTNLTHLMLGYQKSKGLTFANNQIPETIANLTQLDWLNLSQIPLVQPLQPALWNLPITKLRVQDCGITGSLPPQFANISNILADRNEFEGAIPQEIINSTGNTNLSITNNYFDFTDLKPLVEANNYTGLGYSPQRTRDVATEVTTSAGSDIVLTVDDQGIGRPASEQKNASGNVYQWYKDNVAITGANTNTHTIVNAQSSDNGVYYCVITNPTLPDLTIQRANITVNVDASASTDDIEFGQKVKVYPNPTSNNFTIELKGINTVKASLYDINGREIFNKTIHQKEKFNISTLKAGVYLLKVIDENKKVTKRIVKM